MVDWVLYHINLIGHLMPNPIYTYIYMYVGVYIFLRKFSNKLGLI